jgi:hypothetical protein
MAEQFSNTRIGEVVQTCPVQRVEQPLHWLEIVLLGEDDSPIRFEEYLVVLPGGKSAKGYTDGNGRARFEGIITAGVCQIHFPNLDEEAWEFIRTE